MLFGFGAGDTRSHLVRDDETAASISLPIPIPFYEQKESQIYVSSAVATTVELSVDSMK